MILTVLVVGVVCLGGGYLVGSNTGDSGKNSNLNIDGSSSIGPLMTRYVEEFEKFTDIKINLAVTGSGVGIQSVIDDIADLGMSSRDLKASELDRGLVPTVIGIDAIVIIIGPGVSGVTNLTKAQIKGIYEGTINNWNQVGGPNATIVPYIREEGSGTRDGFESLVGIDANAQSAKNWQEQGGTGHMRSAVSTTSMGIGYISLGSLTGADKAVQYNGIDATTANAQSGTYELTRNFLLVTKGAPSGNAAFLISWILSPTGQAILKSMGFVPLYNLA